MMRFGKILIITTLFIMTACADKSPAGQIKAMQKRVDAVEHKAEMLYNQDFEYLVKECQEIENLTQNKEHGKDFDLVMAYLQQYEDIKPVVMDNAAYSRKQLDDLNSDIENNLYDEATTAQYLKDEDDAIRVMEAQLDYFQEKFDEQKKVVKKLRRE